MPPESSNGTAHTTRFTEAPAHPSPNPQSGSAVAAATEIPNPQSNASSLPPLSDHDSLLLTTYLELNFNLDLLAEYTQTPILRLIRWLNLPHIQQHIDEIDQLRARQSAAADLADRRAAIDALKSLLTTTEDPIEKRRAATAILRALSAPRRVTLPDEGGREVGSRAGDRSPNPQPKLVPRPRRTPAPELSGHEAIAAVTRALCDNDNPDPDSGLATLHAFCAKAATINGQPVPEDATDFLEDLDEDLAEKLSPTSCIGGRIQIDTPTHFRESSVQLNSDERCTLATFELRRDSAEEPFLIKAIELTSLNSS